MGDVIEINFRPDAFERVRGDMRKRLADAFTLRGLQDGGELAERIAKQCEDELRTMSKALAFQFQAREPLSQATLDALTEQIQEIGMQAYGAIVRACVNATLETAEAAYREAGR